MRGVKKTTEQFIKDARKVHGDKYDYSKVEYVNNKTYIIVVCPFHGDFKITPHNHLNGHGCKICSQLNKRKSLEDFIIDARQIHGDKYDYSKVEYVNIHTPVCIICPEHDEFWMTPVSHCINGSGCQKCRGLINDSLSFTIKSRQIHGDKYDYSKVEYVKSNKPVCIICPEHGEFWQTPNKHLSGHGCPKCNGKNKTTEELILEFKQIHGDRYDYSNVVYKCSKDRISIICPEHGEFKQSVEKHLMGHGCPECRLSKLENTVSNFLSLHNIDYEIQKSFDWSVNIGKLKFDFYLPDYNTIIECQGEQHFRPINWFGGNIGYEKSFYRDLLKLKLCKEHGINILYFADNSVNIQNDWSHYEVVRDLNVLLEKIQSVK